MMPDQAPEAAAATDEQAAKDDATDAKPDTIAAEGNGGETKQQDPVGLQA